MENLKKFLQLYDKKNNLGFSSISFFPNTKAIYPFGLAFKNHSIQFNVGSTFGKKKTFFYDTYSPFEFKSVEYLEDLDMIVLHSEFGFSVRIYSVQYETITEDFWIALDSNSSIQEQTKIGKSGKLRYYSPFEAYIEIYSENSHSILNSILEVKYNSSQREPYSLETLFQFFDVYSIEHSEGLRQLKDYTEKESISMMNSFVCQKKDDLLDKEVFFYSYNALF